MSNERQPYHVETVYGEETRQRGMKAVAARLMQLRDKQSAGPLTQEERDMMVGCRRALEEMEKMEPVGPLMPPRVGNPDVWADYDADRAKPGDPPPETAGESYCIRCDALPGECSHDGPRYLPPIQYQVVSEPGAKMKMWRVPDWERERVDNPQSSWAKAPVNEAQPGQEGDPLVCDNCGDYLSARARAGGFRYCSPDCLEEGMSRKRYESA